MQSLYFNKDKIEDLPSDLGIDKAYEALDLIFNNPAACYRAFRARLQQNDERDRLDSAMNTGIGIGRGQGIEIGITQGREEESSAQKVQTILKLHAEMDFRVGMIAKFCECEESYVSEVLAMPRSQPL